MHLTIRWKTRKDLSCVNSPGLFLSFGSEIILEPRSLRTILTGQINPEFTEDFRINRFYSYKRR